MFFDVLRSVTYCSRETPKPLSFATNIYFIYNDQILREEEFVIISSPYGIPSTLCFTATLPGVFAIYDRPLVYKRLKL